MLGLGTVERSKFSVKIRFAMMELNVSRILLPAGGGGAALGSGREGVDIYIYALVQAIQVGKGG